MCVYIYIYSLGHSQARLAETIHTMRLKHLHMFGISCNVCIPRAKTGCIMDDVTNVYIPSSCKNTSIWLLVSTCFNPSQKHWPIWIATPISRVEKKHWNILKPSTSCSRSNRAASPSWNSRNPDLRKALQKKGRSLNLKRVIIKSRQNHLVVMLKNV